MSADQDPKSVQFFERQVKDLKHQLRDALKANKLKTQFVATTSHELKTPLQAVDGFLQTAERRLQKLRAAKSQEEADKFLEKLEGSVRSALNASDRMFKLVNKIVALTRAEDMSFAVKKTQFDLSQFFEKVEEDCSQAATQKNIQLDWKIDPANIELNTDETLLYQIMTNLLSNAIRYGDENSIVSVDAKKTGNQTEIRVSNQGIGIDSSEWEEIFQPFFQSQKSQAPKIGSGLGLALCKKYAAGLGGSVAVESGDPKNTTFVLSLSD